MPVAGADARGNRLWSRPWVRRVTYLLVGGATVLTTGAWLLQRPFLGRLLVHELDQLSRRETGLGLEAGSLELHPLEGRLVARNLAWGGDLLRIRTLEAHLDWLSLLGSHPHVYRVSIDSPRVLLDAQRLAGFHLRKHPDSPDLQWRVDHLELQDGTIAVQEPAWGLPSLRAAFRLRGTGQGPRSLNVELAAPALALDTLHGDLRFGADLADATLAARQGLLRLGSSQIRFHGAFAPTSQALDAALSGHVDLAEGVRLLPGRYPSATGSVTFSAALGGTLDQPTWGLDLRGSALHTDALPMQPGTLALTARGTRARATLRNLAWTSPDGTLTAQGQWQQGSGSHLEASAEGLALAPLARFTRAEFLDGLRASGTLQATLPGDPWKPHLGSALAKAQLQFQRDGRSAGRAELDAADGRLDIGVLELNTPTLTFHGNASCRFRPGDPKALTSVTAQGEAATDAARVAEMLKAWKVVDLDMGGAVQGRAQFAWDRVQGLKLDAEAAVRDPRYHGATADRATAQVAIRRDVLWVDEIRLWKGAGRGFGDLRLTWGKAGPGEPEIDMCYRASELPIEEGLKAADLGDLVCVSGLGSGWVRLVGPYDRIMLYGGAEGRSCEAYGLRFPAVSGSLTLDIEGDHLRVEDIRAADAPEHLGRDATPPEGLLALQGAVDLDLKRSTIQANLTGAVDSRLLDLPGPRIQCQVDARLDGPWAAPCGPWAAPEGTLALSRGRCFLESQSFENIQGSLDFHGGALAAWLGLGDRSARFAELRAWSRDSRLKGALDVDISADTLDTPHLVPRVTGDMLGNLRLALQAEGEWGPEGLAWRGRTRELEGRSESFELAQTQPGSLKGDAAQAIFDLHLGGRTPALAQKGQDSAKVHCSGTLPFSTTAPLEIHAEGSTDLADLKRMLDSFMELDAYSLLADFKPSGIANFDLAAGGTYGDPTLDGELNLRGGRVQVLTYPQSLENLDFTVHFKGRDMLIPESAPLKAQMALGALTAWGRATWQPGGLSLYDFKASLKDFQFRDLPEGFEMQGSLDATLRGSDEEGGVMKGQIRAERMTYRADIDLTNLILANSLGGSPIFASLTPEDPLARIDLDLDLRSGAEPWAFDTNLLKLQCRPGGGFKVLGTLAKPGLKGRLDILPGGRITNILPAGDVILESGSIDFTDPRLMNPVLNIQGRVDVSPYQVNLAVNGSLDQLSVVPTSTPSLRQDEVVAILVNPSIAPNIGTNASPSSQTIMNTGLASTGSGFLTTLALANFQEQLRRAFNLDRVSVALRTGTTGVAETNITLGKSFNLFDQRTPITGTYLKSGQEVTVSGQMEWRIGDFVMQLGASRTGFESVTPTGEVRYTWSPR